ncbi:MAG: bifunctional alpha,alpha-trehalose-phosphate synthase (UDP-forming)/trehalose-phosphatase [Phycisphaerae bacterium]|nr:bifunctional alpha,alpha-trehalose-phosphate synthase (UDP-forming)/trehalose-phosphatase [Phycisphaerae bacterium]
MAKLQEQSGPIRLVPVQINADLDRRYYGGFCNDTIWPLFHYFSSLTNFVEDTFEAYHQANRQFAQRLESILEPDDWIWIHDYQLMLLPDMIRTLFPDANIGFFLHIPFPSFELFRLMPRPWRQSLLRGMLGSDVIGFHTFDYAQYFLRAVSRSLGVETTPTSTLVEGRITRVEPFPLGIDYRRFQDALHSPSVMAERENLQKILGGKKLIFSVDRLDYTKGLLERLLGFEYFLEAYPEWHQKIVFNMVVIPSREIVARYQDMKKEIEATVGRINGKFGSLVWRPLVYEYRSLAFAEMVALYAASEVGLITPIRDGMNLVAKEYLACQGYPLGVLILSEMAGASAELSEAILVNPTDKKEVAAAIAKALSMPEEERKTALMHMQNRLKRYDVYSWAQDFFETMKQVRREYRIRRVRLLSEPVKNEIVNQYMRASRRIFFLDYDGTLVPFSRQPETALPARPLLDQLNRLAAIAGNILVIISGRRKEFLDRCFPKINLVLVAEHGAFIRWPGSEWVSEVDTDPAWKQSVMPILQRYTDRCNGAFIEDKVQSLVWHYRNAESEVGQLRSQELKDELRELFSRDSILQVIAGEKIIEVKKSGYNKGTVATKLLASMEYEFLLAIGDDTTDEDLFHALPPKALTLKVGTSPSLARFNLMNQQEVVLLLERLATTEK